MIEELTRSAELLERDEGDPQRVAIRIVPYGPTAATPQGPERFAPGSLVADDGPVHLEAQRHGGDVVGIMEELEQRDDGAYGVFRVSDSPGGRELVKLIEQGILSAASAVFRPITSRRTGGTIERVHASLRRVAVLPRGAYSGAQVLEVREDMTDEQATPAEVQAEPAVAVTPYDDAALLERMDKLDEQLGRISAAADTPEAPTLEVATWEDVWQLSRGEQAAELETSLQEQLQARAAFADNITTDNTGLMGLANPIGRIIEPVAAKRRTVNAVGLASLPSTSMSFDYITFDAVGSTGYQALVTEQATEKTDISSGTHGWNPVNVAIATYAGGSDNSYQLLERSSPSFRALLLRQYASEWAFATNAAFIAALATDFTADTLTLGTDLTTLIPKLIDQSIAIEAETGSPMNVCLMSSTVWAAVAKLESMMDPANPVQNVSGTVNAGQLDMRLQGLTLVHEPQLTAGTMVTTRGGTEAAAWHETFKGIISAENVLKLGQDIACYGYGAPAVYRAAAGYYTTVTLA